MNNKKRQNKKTSVEQITRRGIKSFWILFSISAVIVLSIIATYGYIYLNEPNKNAYQIYGEKEVPSNAVCMKGNLIKSKSTIRVEILGKSYHVCCEKCENILLKNINYRQATDPLTGKTIDKSDSYIVLNPTKNGKVIYFESADNYQNFKSLISK